MTYKRVEDAERVRRLHIRGIGGAGRVRRLHIRGVRGTGKNHVVSMKVLEDRGKTIMHLLLKSGHCFVQNYQTTYICEHT